MADRIYENILKLISIAIKEFTTLTEDDTCYTDEAVLGEIKDVVEGFAEYKQIMHGFKGEWDQSTKLEEKLTFREMWHNYHNFKKEHTHDLKHECPMKSLWKKFMGDVTPEDIMGDIFGSMPAMPKMHAPPMHHQQPHHAKQHGFDDMFSMFFPKPIHHKEEYHHRQQPKHQQSAWFMMPQMQMPQMHMPQMQMPQMHMPKMEFPQMSNPFMMNQWGAPSQTHYQQTPSFFGQQFHMPHLF